MSLTQIIPTSFKNHLRLLRVKKKYPDNNIGSHKVGDIYLGTGAAIGENADIRSGVKIGNYSYVNPETIIASGSIGNYCSIGYRCQIGMFEHPTNHASTSPLIYNKDRSLLNLHTWDEIHSPPIIGNDVWVGSNVIILQGVKIGNGAIIAGGAVVTKDVPPYGIVGGIPAKLIRYRFGDEQIDFLEQLKWWDLPVDELKKHKQLFETKEDWVKQIVN